MDLGPAGRVARGPGEEVRSAGSGLRLLPADGVSVLVVRPILQPSPVMGLGQFAR